MCANIWPSFSFWVIFLEFYIGAFKSIAVSHFGFDVKVTGVGLDPMNVNPPCCNPGTCMVVVVEVSRLITGMAWRGESR